MLSAFTPPPGSRPRDWHLPPDDPPCDAEPRLYWDCREGRYLPAAERDELAALQAEWERACHWCALSPDGWADDRNIGY